AAAEPGGEQDAPLVAEEPALERERHHEPDDEAADDVHGERAGWEGMAGDILDGSGQPVAGDRADETSDGHQPPPRQRNRHGPTFEGVPRGVNAENHTSPAPTVLY